jgi:cytoskeletal protein RodZ
VNRDGIKTVIGLLVIGLIIVATFLYGNHQRQAQLQHDQDLRRQKQDVSQMNPSASSKPAPTTSVAPTSKPQPGVATPSANAIQGQGSGAVTPHAASTTSNGNVTVTDTTPKTGPSAVASSLALIALISSGVYYRRSKRELKFALIRSK